MYPTSLDTCFSRKVPWLAVQGAASVMASGVPPVVLGLYTPGTLFQLEATFVKRSLKLFLHLEEC